jgi:hypothetical protein
MSGGITMSKALLNTKPRYPREGKSVHPLPVEIPATSNEFDDWTEKDFDDEIKRLQKRVKELETEKIKKRVDRALVWDDDDDIMNDPDVRKMVENGEHICHMFDGECLACEMDEEVSVLTEEVVANHL